VTCEGSDEGWRWTSEELEDVGVEFVLEDVSKSRPIGSGEREGEEMSSRLSRSTKEWNGEKSSLDDVGEGDLFDQGVVSWRRERDEGQRLERKER